MQVKDWRNLELWLCFLLVMVFWVFGLWLFWGKRKRCCGSSCWPHEDNSCLDNDDVERLARRNRRRRTRSLRGFARLEAMELYRRMGDPPPSYDDSILLATTPPQTRRDSDRLPPEYTPVLYQYLS